MLHYPKLDVKIIIDLNLILNSNLIFKFLIFPKMKNCQTKSNNNFKDYKSLIIHESKYDIIS